MQREVSNQFPDPLGELAQNAQSGTLDSCREGCTRLGRTHARVNQRPLSIIANECVHIYGTQRKRDGHSDLPGIWGHLTSFGNWFNLPLRLRQWRLLHEGFVLYCVIHKRFSFDCMARFGVVSMLLGPYVFRDIPYYKFTRCRKHKGVGTWLLFSMNTLCAVRKGA